MTIATAGELRAATIVLEAFGRTTVINEPGPPFDDATTQTFLAAYVESLADRRPAVVVASGSLPHGAPTGLYAEVVRLASAHGARTVVDVGGPVLAAALAAGPALVKPNLAEAESVLRSLAGLGSDGSAGGGLEAVDESGNDVADRCVPSARALGPAEVEAQAVAALLDAVPDMTSAQVTR